MQAYFEVNPLSSFFAKGVTASPAAERCIEGRSSPINFLNRPPEPVTG